MDEPGGSIPFDSVIAEVQSDLETAFPNGQITSPGSYTEELALKLRERAVCAVAGHATGNAPSDEIVLNNHDGFTYNVDVIAGPDNAHFAWRHLAAKCKTKD